MSRQQKSTALDTLLVVGQPTGEVIRAISVFTVQEMLERMRITIMVMAQTKALDEKACNVFLDLIEEAKAAIKIMKDPTRVGA